jgi:DNA-binding transcriptional regulator YdaS (Cro superfamily)
MLPLAQLSREKMSKTGKDEGVRLAIEAAGGVRPLARELGIKSPAIIGWTRIPADRIVQVEAVTGVRRETLRPDLYRCDICDLKTACAESNRERSQAMVVTQQDRKQDLLVMNSTRHLDQTRASRHRGSSAFTPEEALQEAIRRAGGQGALARKLGIKQQAVAQWRIAPAARALPIERLTGIRREHLRPDLFDFVIRDVSGGIAVGEYKGGLLTDEEVRKQMDSYRDLISKKIRLLQADELEQAKELLATGYKAAAAVIAGVVLETALRRLCSDRGLPVGKLEKINADLANAGTYNERMHRRVTTLAEIRNKAAHGDTAGFSGADVRGMITDVERFISDFLAA